MLKLNNIIKKDKAPEAVVGTEELFSIESNKLKDTTKELELTEGGMLVAIEDLAGEAIEGADTVGDISKEDIIPLVNRPMRQCSEGSPSDNKPSNTLFIKNEFNIYAYLFDDCAETIDTLVHMLFQATESTNIHISYCAPNATMFESIELIGAINSSKAKIDLNISYIDSALDLLLLTLKNVTLTIDNGLVICPISEWVGGSVYNMQTVIDATKDYQSMVYAKLVDNKILTEEEEIGLMRNGNMFYLSKEELEKRRNKV